MMNEADALSHLDEAIEKNYIEVWYQPVFRSLSGVLCEFEALARWRDPDEGLLSPATFIPALEKNRKIHLVDCHVIRTVCKCLRGILDEGKPVVPVSLNFSQLDFELCDIVSILEETSEHYKIPRNLLHVEIT